MLIMDLNKKYKYQFYQEQNIQLRKNIRQKDLALANQVQQNKKINNACIFLVLGPRQAGKTSLLRTLQLALNGTEGWGINQRPEITIVDIKKSPKWQIEGVKEVKEIEKKYEIKGWQLNTYESPSLRYKKALQFVEKGLGFCLPESIYKGNGLVAKVCLICMDIMEELSYDELTYLKFLVTDLKERNLKVLYVLTKVDKVVLPSQYERGAWIESRMAQVAKEFELKDREDVILFESYVFRDKEKQKERRQENKIRIFNGMEQGKRLETNEEINYYSLQLVLRLMGECEKYDSVCEQQKQFLLCGCN